MKKKRKKGSREASQNRTRRGIFENREEKRETKQDRIKVKERRKLPPKLTVRD